MIGVWFSYGENDCKLEALLYLKIAGAFGLALHAIELILHIIQQIKDMLPADFLENQQVGFWSKECIKEV